MNPRPRLIVMVTSVLLLLLVLGCDSDNGGASATSTPVLTPAPLTEAALRNATYPSEFAPGSGAKLTDGKFMSAGQVGTTTITLLDVQGSGAIDADASPDAAVVLASNTGGSGTFIELVAVLNDNGNPMPAAKSFLGDRVVVNSITIANGQIVLAMRVHGPGDGQCCPSQTATKRYVLSGSALSEVP
jgi:hypothetical protein